ncbi:unnamed protein product [Calicophoron daubneyi]|uniref:Transcription elongation factor Eaf N-terminal domain-containing protein n=1 Tax=Calicophoron daubneyi TaxID=300641 RepID=A0AAV2T6J5_CALDB
MQLNGTFDVKLGKSFLDPNSATYMTMRCDFMPASVDRSQPGSIRVDNGKEVVVNLPNVASVGAGSTIFRGSARPVQKECILIYNKRTGELTLERIAHAVQLKKTREEQKHVQNLQPVSSMERQQLGSADSKPTSPTSVKNKQQYSSESSSSVKPISQPNSLSKTRTLSSSSSDSSTSLEDGEEHGSSSDDSLSSDSNSSSSNLSSLSDDRDKRSSREQSVKNQSKLHAVDNQNSLPAHRNLIEHDLRLSDSDSDGNS